MSETGKKINGLLAVSGKQVSMKQEATMQREPSFGERAVGLYFNPSGDIPTQQIKERAAALIDTLNDYRNATEDGEMKRMFSVAITEVQTGQMWGVKAATWKLGQ